MDTYVALLQNYSSRDKILRIVCYGSAFASGAFKGHTAKTLGVIAQRMSSCRTINRLFDDLPMWTVTRTLGASDRDIVSRCLSALANIVMQGYFPLEKIAWAADNEILSLNSSPFWTAGVACWGIYMVLNLFRSLRELVVAKARIIKVLKQRKLESPERSGEKDIEFKKQLSELRISQQKEILMILKNLADLVMVVNWLPLGVLWSGKLSASRNAFFGVISSIIGLYMSVIQHKMAVKSKKA